eukprot:TRINITY_DN431_c0_g1_i14.p1 TRINITY_DN431_c0_g1~~TRINITY_DN431_c0_g1_i14.p1  ORF type:complete len:335 (-),score=82.55 TRINITY_DN431_c0_g1_i14:420-1391(-)
MSTRAQSAKFTEEHKSMLKELITGDKELRDHIIFQNISSRDQQTSLWRRLIDRFNQETSSNYSKEQISNCLSRIKRFELQERDRRQSEGDTDFSDLWLTLDANASGIKSEPKSRNNPAHFTRDDIDELKSIITGDSEIRGLIFHGNSMTNEQSSGLWARLVDKFNEVTGKCYNKNQIYRCLSRIKYKEKKAHSKPMPDDDLSNQDYWNNTTTDDGYTDNYDPANTNGMDHFMGLIKGEGDMLQGYDDSTGGVGGDAVSGNGAGGGGGGIAADWSNPLATYLRAILPGVLEEQKLKRKNLELQNENLKLQNKKLKLDLKERLGL